MGQVGIFGGTFDPVHWGHLLAAQTALTQVGLEQVIWIPAHHPPHKDGLAYVHRRCMVERAIADNQAFTLVSAHSSPSEPDYAIGTLLQLQAIYPNCQWYWIIGLDAFQTLPRWYRRQELIPACNWLVVPRLISLKVTDLLIKINHLHSGCENPLNWLCYHVVQQLAEQNISIRWQLLQMPLIGISSSLIRHSFHQGRSIRYWVPQAVQSYIETHNLYKNVKKK